MLTLKLANNQQIDPDLSNLSFILNKKYFSITDPYTEYLNT